VDDFDLMKGTALKLQAFSRFLDAYPEQKDHVTLVEVIVPSRGPLQERKVARENIMHEVKAIRDKYGEAVLEILERDSVELTELVALYTVAHVSGARSCGRAQAAR
jgi:trehalose-6-phosphate synthase